MLLVILGRALRFQVTSKPHKIPTAKCCNKLDEGCVGWCATRGQYRDDEAQRPSLPADLKENVHHMSWTYLWACASRIPYGHIQTKLFFICGFSLNPSPPLHNVWFWLLLLWHGPTRALGQNRIGTHTLRSHRTVLFVFAAQTLVSCLEIIIIKQTHTYTSNIMFEQRRFGLGCRRSLSSSERPCSKNIFLLYVLICSMTLVSCLELAFLGTKRLLLGKWHPKAEKKKLQKKAVFPHRWQAWKVKR